MAFSGGLAAPKDRKRQLEFSATKKNKWKESHETIPICFIISTDVSSAVFFGGSTKQKHTLTAAQVSMSKHLGLTAEHFWIDAYPRNCCSM